MPQTMTLIVALAAAVGFLVAAAGGFLVGYRYAASAPTRLLRRAGRDTERCLTQATSAVDLAGRLCAAVAAATTATEQQITALLERQRCLAEAIVQLRPQTRAIAFAESGKIEWIMEPLDRETELPNSIAFEANIGRLLAAAKDHPRAGILLVSLDGLDRLRRRIEEKDLVAVRRSAARLLCRTVREDDLACCLDEATFALVMPDADPAEALSQAVAAREAFRSHPFRIGADGPELLVTASFGFTPVLPADEVRLLLDRAEAGVARSRRCGRNRLHAYEPHDCRISLVPDAPQLIPQSVAVLA